MIAALLFLVGSPSGDLLRSPGAAAAHARRSDLPPLVFVMLDEFPTQVMLTADGHIDAVRYPNLASLAEGATWYRNYSVVAPGTLQSIPALLSSRNPTVAAPLWTNYPDSIFSLLAPTHELEVSESVTQLCGFSDCPPEASDGNSESDELELSRLLKQTAEVWVERVSLGPRSEVDLGQFQEEREEVVDLDVDGSDQRHDQRELRGRPVRVTEFVDSFRRGERPAFYYLHLVLPHQPWNFYPNGVEYAAPSETIPGAKLVSPSDEAIGWNAAQIEQRLLWQAQYTDQLVGEMIGRLRDIGLYDDAVIVVTADHGIAVEAALGRRKSIADDTLDDIAYVPLIIKAVGQQRGAVDDSNLMGGDLLPTLADRLGVPISFPTVGYPAGGAEVRARGDEKEIYDFGGSFPAKFKRIVRFDSSAAPDFDRRLVGSQPADMSPMAGLVARLGLETVLGTPLTDLDPVQGGSAAIAGLSEMRDPPTDGPLLGVVQGAVRSPSIERDTHVVVAVNGTVVSAALVDASGSFSTLLPEGALRRESNEIRVALIDGSEVTELTLG